MKCRKNNFKILFLITFFLGGLFYLPALGQNQINPVAVVVSEGGIDIDDEKKYIKVGEGEVSEPLSSPLKVIFDGRVTKEENTDIRCEWRFTQPDGSSYLRSDEYTERDDFDVSGRYHIKLFVTFTDEEGKITELESDDIILIVSESFLKVPNAFSPNDDGINDVFKVSYQSLIKFNAYVFNRWGKQIYHWGLANIDEGWDGTSNGKPVKDGVYFIVIEAEGSDGVKYKHKGDINILRGYRGTGSTTNTGE